MVIYLLDKGHT